MRIFSIFLYLNFCCAFTISAQLLIKGTVKNAEDFSTIEGAVITLLETDSSTIVKYTVSDSQGKFNMTIDQSAANAYLIKGSRLGYESQILFLKNKAALDVSFSLSPKISNLREIIIKPPKIQEKSDTISYDVASFANVQDKSIGDVLRKMPGIEIQENGTVLYNGKAINKFYIEGLDLLNSKYGLAVNHISPGDVKSVEVLEGHQPIKILGLSNPTDRSALNLRLKESSKSRWLGHLDISGGGRPFLWKMDVLALRFNAKGQDMNLLQTNNVGENIKNQFSTLTLEDYINGRDQDHEQLNLIKVKAEQAPLSEGRSIFNQTFVATANSLRILKKDYQIKTNFDYINDRLNFFKNSVTSYYNPLTEQRNVFENTAGLSRQNQAKAELSINKNTENFYLKNKLSGQISWDLTDVYTNGSSTNFQQSRLPYHYIENGLNLIKSYANKRFAISSFNYLTFQPEELSFKEDLHPQLVKQSANYRDFSSNTKLTLTTLHKTNLTIDYSAGIKFNFQNLLSEITDTVKALTVQDSLGNLSHRKAAKYYGSVSAAYKTDRFNFRITLPLDFYDTRFTNIFYNTKINNSRLYFNPGIQMTYKFGPKLSLHAKAEMITKLPELGNLSEGYIYQTYRSLTAGNRAIGMEQRQSYNLSLNYRSPVNSLFTSLSFSHILASKNQILERSFQNYIIFERLLPHFNYRTNTVVSGRVSKGIDQINAVAAIAISYQRSTAEILQNDLLLGSNHNSMEINPNLTMKLTSVFNLDYNGNLRISKLTLGDKRSSGSVLNYSQKMLVGLILSKRLNIKTGFDYVYNGLTSDRTVTAFFADFNIQYLPLKKLTVELGLKNLLNKKEIAYNQFETASSSSSIYRVRPFNALLGLKYTF